MADLHDPAWDSMSWEESRRAHLRAALALTVRPRLVAMDELGTLSDKLAVAPKTSVDVAP